MKNVMGRAMVGVLFWTGRGWQYRSRYRLDKIWAALPTHIPICSSTSRNARTYSGHCFMDINCIRTLSLGFPLGPPFRYPVSVD